MKQSASQDFLEPENAPEKSRGLLHDEIAGLEEVFVRQLGRHSASLGAAHRSLRWTSSNTIV